MGAVLPIPVNRIREYAARIDVGEGYPTERFVTLIREMDHTLLARRDKDEDG